MTSEHGVEWTEMQPGVWTARLGWFQLLAMRGHWEMLIAHSLQTVAAHSGSDFGDIDTAKSAAVTAAMELLLEAIASVPCETASFDVRPDGWREGMHAVADKRGTPIVLLTYLTPDDLLAIGRSCIAAALKAKENDRG